MENELSGQIVELVKNNLSSIQWDAFQKFTKEADEVKADLVEARATLAEAQATRDTATAQLNLQCNLDQERIDLDKERKDVEAESFALAIKEERFKCAEEKVAFVKEIFHDFFRNVIVRKSMSGVEPVAVDGQGFVNSVPVSKETVEEQV